MKGDASLMFLIFTDISANRFPYISHYALMAFLFFQKRVKILNENVHDAILKGWKGFKKEQAVITRNSVEC